MRVTIFAHARVCKADEAQIGQRTQGGAQSHTCAILHERTHTAPSDAHSFTQILTRCLALRDDEGQHAT